MKWFTEPKVISQGAQYIANFHPFGRIPALEDGDVIVFESRAICRYLVAKYAKDASTLRAPTQPAEIAHFEQLASVEYSYFDPPVTQLAYEKLFKRCVLSVDCVLPRSITKAKFDQA